MFHAVCNVCQQSNFSPDCLVAYTLRSKRIERVDLQGRQPWSGVRVICLDCLRTFALWLEQER